MGLATFHSWCLFYPQPPSSHSTFSNLEVKVAVESSKQCNKDWPVDRGWGWWGNGTAGIVWVSLHKEALEKRSKQQLDFISLGAAPHRSHQAQWPPQVSGVWAHWGLSSFLGSEHPTEVRHLPLLLASWRCNYIKQHPFPTPSIIPLPFPDELIYTPHS